MATLPISRRPSVSATSPRTPCLLQESTDNLSLNSPFCDLLTTPDFDSLPQSTPRLEYDSFENPGLPGPSSAGPKLLAFSPKYPSPIQCHAEDISELDLSVDISVNINSSASAKELNSDDNETPPEEVLILSLPMDGFRCLSCYNIHSASDMPFSCSRGDAKEEIPGSTEISVVYAGRGQMKPDWDISALRRSIGRTLPRRRKELMNSQSPCLSTCEPDSISTSSSRVSICNSVASSSGTVGLLSDTSTTRWNSPREIEDVFYTPAQPLIVSG